MRIETWVDSTKLGSRRSRCFLRAYWFHHRHLLKLFLLWHALIFWSLNLFFGLLIQLWQIKINMLALWWGWFRTRCWSLCILFVFVQLIIFFLPTANAKVDFCSLKLLCFLLNLINWCQNAMLYICFDWLLLLFWLLARLWYNSTPSGGGFGQNILLRREQSIALDDRGTSVLDRSADRMAVQILVPLLLRSTYPIQIWKVCFRNFLTSWLWFSKSTFEKSSWWFGRTNA